MPFIIAKVAVTVLIAAHVFSSPIKADSSDLVKVAIGLTAFGIIANEINKSNQQEESLDLKRATDAAAEAAAEAATTTDSPVLPLCISPVWDGKNWRNKDQRTCTPTPEVCKREIRRFGHEVVTFDFNCMQNEGFRLSKSM